MGRKAVQGMLALIGCLGVVGLGSEGAIAAETILLRYQGFGRAVPVFDLATLAQTGEAPDSVGGLLNMANEDPATLQDLLTRNLTVNPNLLDSVLYSWPGEWALDQMGGVIHPPSGQASRQALRSAIVLAAAKDSQISLLEVLEHYPTPQVVLEGDRIADAYTQLAALLTPLSIF
ncbi:MAG TPA: alpha/beta hydrolase [Trichocoleus sp.]